MRKNKRLSSLLIVSLLSIFLISCGGNTQANNKNNIATETVENKQIEPDKPKEIKNTGWTQENGNWYCYDTDGKPKTGWVKDKNKSYYLNSVGIMQKGWIKDNGKDYYLDNSGLMQTGWKESDGKWYYLNSDGTMATNKTVDGYYLTSNGAMQEKSISTQSNPTNKPNNKSSNSNATGTEKGQTAYITQYGSKYHRIPKCGNSKTSTPTTVEKAEKSGYGRCSKCW